MSSLPEYVVADIEKLEEADNTSIRRKALPIEFPLTEEDRRDIDILVQKFESEKGAAAGLSCPEIGISKRVIVFAVSQLVAKHLKCQPFLKTVWINPSYQKVNNDMHTIYEQCYAIKDMYGPVKRHKSIFYTAYSMKGRLVKGRADGYTARVIQHGVDHLNGILYIDFVPVEKLMTYSAYLRKYKL